MEAIWYKHIDEIAADPKRALIIVHGVGNVEETAIEKYAVEKLHGRCLVRHGGGFYTDFNGKKFAYPKKAFENNGFQVSSERIKTRGFGEFTLACVVNYTYLINKDLGMKNPVPYKNPQSTLLPKKSIAGKTHYYPNPEERALMRKILKRRPDLKPKVRAWLNPKMKRYAAARKADAEIRFRIERGRRK